MPFDFYFPWRIFFDANVQEPDNAQETASMPGKQSLQRRRKRGQSLLMLDYLLEDPVNLKSRERAYSYIMHFEFEITALGERGVTQPSLSF